MAMVPGMTTRTYLPSLPDAGFALAVIDSLPDPVVVVAPDEAGVWRIEWVNPAFESVTGWNAEEVVGSEPREAIGPLTDPGLVVTALTEAAEGATIRRRTVLRRRCRPPVPCELRGSLLAGTDKAWAWAQLVVEETGRAAETVATQVDRRLRAIVQHASDVVLVLDGTGRVTCASPSVERLFGVLPEPSGENGWFCGLFHPDDLPKALATLWSGPSVNGRARVLEARLRLVDGSWTWFELSATNLLEDPDVAGYVVKGRDITERKQTESLLSGELSVLETMAGSHTLAPVLRRLAELAESFIPGTAFTIGLVDDDGVIRQAASASLPAAVVAALDAEPPESPLGRVFRGGEQGVVCTDLGTDPVWATIGAALATEGFRSCWWMAVRGASSEDVLGVVLVFHPDGRAPDPNELTVLERLRHLATLALQRARFERRLEHQAVHDGLTGIPNRTLLLDRVDRALEVGRRRGTHTAVLFIDVDRFKLVNDGLGHAVGDKLLRQVAVALAGELEPGDTVGRFGGDEFVVVLEAAAGEAVAMALAQRLLAALDNGLEVSGQAVRISASIGVAMAGPDAEDVGPEAMIRNACAAMYRAKDAGRARVELFEETLNAEAVHRYELEQGLRSAMAGGELTVVYQPQVRLADGRIVGVEALVRWNRPGHEQVGARELIPVAEDTGLIVAIGAWVLSTACDQAVAWDESPNTAGLAISVNLSARQISDPGLVAAVAGILMASGLAAERVCLEVTESALAADPVAASAILQALKDLGVRLSIDDFGTGYATLDYLRRFSMADELKIDRSFVSGIADHHSPDAAIVSASIVLADALGFEVVAEGVETAEQLAVLRRLGCGKAQGFYFGSPIPPGEIDSPQGD